ncbi:MAG TPA: TerB family tellurite resistance protein [Flavobacterium sp.]|uniref:TerB family tellurite resistance protein n=1 Tax=Flavobacterium sp. TaxID=239 RepID=UPI002DBFF8E3|nr:TerB family tellurite resistance protein [Flavobacterium sp.]HEU4788378.1 TerB family tellurite resistance protein [Flavobacterium sp.]
MNTHVEKINLLSEMIAFSVVDGRLHEREYQFVWIVAQELGISKKEFKDLFHQELPTGIIKSEFERIQQFYRLALLMHVDNVLHQKEEEAIRQIAINMGLNPSATNRILKLMKASPNVMISPEVLLDHFQEQNN